MIPVKALGFGLLGAALALACGAGPAEEAGGDEVAASGVAGGAAAIEGVAAGEGQSGEGRDDAAGAEGPALGPGFVVWESNRGGAWRIWIRALAGGEPRRLTPDEPGRVHCCPHVSPDGRRIAYLSSREGAEEYPADGALGELRLIAPDGGGERAVAAAARSYFENRAVVWRSPEELIHIDGQRATVALDLVSGRTRRLADPPTATAWLIDPTLSWATTGWPAFAPYDPAQGAVAPRRQLGGCQPYFSRDGRWGFWTAGAGGPIDRLELAAERRSTILDKADPRVPDGFGYAYFPMLSADGGLFAWAASRGGHDHFRTDYEVFVAESDAESLELVGPPLRITRHPGTDRFPDVWQPPLVLGRHVGEAPVTVRLTAPSAGAWRWSLGDGASGERAAAEGAVVEHTWGEPGRYEVTARLGEETLRGLVVARPPRPPRPLSAVARAGGRQLEVLFDEPIEADGASLELVSGAEIAGWAAAADGRSLRLSLAEPLATADRLTIAGVRDRARRPNAMAPATLEVEPPAWPASREGLAFLWQTADAANLVPDPELGVDRAYTLAASGTARLDGHFAMVADGGTFGLPESEAAPLVAALQATNELSLEATIVSGGVDGRIIALAGERAIAFWLEQASGRLRFGLYAGGRGPQAYPRVELGELSAQVPAHLVVTYQPGRLSAYVDGERRFETAELQADFYHWREAPLVFGDGGWRGRIEGVAIYDRVLAPAEVGEAYRLYRAQRAARPEIPRSVVEARLVARSRTPTLAEISPYREALLMADFAVERLVDGPPVGAELRAAQWAILDGAVTAAGQAAPGERLRLTVEPFAAQPQLESVFLADTLAGSPPAELLYIVEAAPAR